MIKKFGVTICLFIILVSFVIISNLNSKDNDSSIINAVQSITGEECLDIIENIANDECAGRATGDEGYIISAEYIASQFKNMDIQPAVNDTSYFQSFEIDYNRIGSDNELILEVPVAPAGIEDTLLVNYKLGDDYLPLGFSGSCHSKKKIVFAGYGITSPENEWDDYKDIDVKDKFVLILGGTPRLKDANFGRNYRLRNKVNFARDAGAIGLISIGSPPIGIISNRRSIPSIIISEKVANDFLKGTGYSIESLKEKMEGELEPFSFELPYQIKLEVNSELLVNQKTMNVIGFLPGSDKKLRDEYIVIGAHLDHIGKMDDIIFYGANDNASGVGMTLEIAEAFSLLKTRPKRSIVFILFTGEEIGLLGSKYYVNHPVFPIKNTKAMINLDMVGSGKDAIMLVGGHTFPDFTKIFDKYSDEYIQMPVKRRWTSPNSDHYSFHDAGIPALFLYVMSGPPTYHTTYDKPETLSPDDMQKVGRLVFRVAWELANEKKIKFKLVENE